jgi:hypothetical protein
VAKILELGIVGSVCFQPFEVHISVFMHFYYECDITGFANVKTKEYVTRYQSEFLPKNFYDKIKIRGLG